MYETPRFISMYDTPKSKCIKFWRRNKFISNLFAWEHQPLPVSISFLNYFCFLATTKFHYPNKHLYVACHCDLSLALAWKWKKKKKVQREKIDVAASSLGWSTSRREVVVQKELKPILLFPSSSWKLRRRFLPIHA